MGKLAINIYMYMYCRSILQHVQWRSFKTKNQSFLFSTTQNNLFHIMWRMAIITVHTCVTCPSKSFMWTVHGPNVVFCCILFCCCVVLCCVVICVVLCFVLFTVSTAGNSFRLHSRNNLITGNFHIHFHNFYPNSVIFKGQTLHLPPWLWPYQTTEIP